MSASQASGQRDALPEASLQESVRVIMSGLLPVVVRGLFSPRKWAQKALTAANTDGRLVAEMSRIRRRHGGQGVRLLGGRLVVLWGREAIEQVLEQSADVYASDSGAKGKGMAHFQPDALTLSRGEEWRDRRAFNEAVLATKQRVHPDAQRFVAVAREEAQVLSASDGQLAWPAWELLWDHVTLRVIFGDGAREDHELTGLLESLMGEANRIVGTGASDELYEFQGRLERYVRDPEPGSLLARFADAPHTDRTRVVHQIPHWMFATRDTLGSNAFRALAVIVADPALERRVREEISGADLADAETVQGLTVLEGCLEEAMRLWPTVPLLARETTRETTLAGTRLEEGTQVMLLNVFNHRDREAVPDADRLVPERWQGDGRDPRFNHLSNGSQYCPGIPLVHLLGKAVVAQTLDRFTLELREPQLPPGGPLPHMLDFYSVRFGAEPRGERA